MEWLDEAKELFNRIMPIPEEEWEKASRFLVLKRYEKNEYLLNMGEMAAHSYLILNGIVRLFYLTEGGREYITGFAREGHFTGSVTSIIGGYPSRFFIQALEPVRSVILPRKGIQELYDGHRCWDRFGRIISERALMCFEMREGEVLDSLEERYRNLVKNDPELVRRVPQHYLASYLGVTHVALSRVKGRIKKKSTA